MTSGNPKNALINKKVTVGCNIAKVNHYLRKAKTLAVRSITPLYSDDTKVICGFNLHIEGPERQVSYFSRLLAKGFH